MYPKHLQCANTIAIKITCILGNNNTSSYIFSKCTIDGGNIYIIIVPELVRQ
jgi:hypothetical protein